MSLAATPGQTVGPFFGYALPYGGGADLVAPGQTDAILLHGQVLDGAGEPVPDAMVELWQPDGDGVVAKRPGSLRREAAGFTGWGRAATDDTGHFRFTTVTPGSTAPGKGAHFALTVFARGLLDRLFTRAYVPTDTALLSTDPLLVSVPSERRATLIATADDDGYRFDIRLQGDDETVFLTYPGHQHG
jgi:protocatechuate 3,4-dioxygenase alpha subunit